MWLWLADLNDANNARIGERQETFEKVRDKMYLGLFFFFFRYLSVSVDLKVEKKVKHVSECSQ